MDVRQRHLCEVMRGSGVPFVDTKKQKVILTNFILSNEDVVNIPSIEEEEELSQKLTSFLGHAIQRYRKASCNFEKFLKSNKQFLDNKFPLPDFLMKTHGQSSDEELSPIKLVKTSPPRKVGRPSLPYAEKSERSKQLESAKIRELFAPGAIFRAASQQPGPKGKLMRAVDSETGLTATRALEAIQDDSQIGLIHNFFWNVHMICPKDNEQNYW